MSAFIHKGRVATVILGVCKWSSIYLLGVIEHACSPSSTCQPFPLSLCLKTASSRKPVFSSVSLLNICPLDTADCLSILLWHKPYKNNESDLVSLPSSPQGLAHCLTSHRCSIKYNRTNAPETSSHLIPSKSTRGRPFYIHFKDFFF